jgi:hypothetical protein
VAITSSGGRTPHHQPPKAALPGSRVVADSSWNPLLRDLAGKFAVIRFIVAEAAGERVAKSKTWPESPRALAGRLRRAATFLRKIGLEVTFGREGGRARTRTIHITTSPNDPASENAGARPSAPSASSAATPNPNPANGFSAPPLRTVAKDVDGRADGSGKGNAPTVRANPLKTNTGTAADGTDADGPPQSALEEINSRGWRARL